MQNAEGQNKVNYGVYESSDYKRCKACVKLSYIFDGQPSSKVSQELCGVA